MVAFKNAKFTERHVQIALEEIDQTMKYIISNYTDASTHRKYYIYMPFLIWVLDLFSMQVTGVVFKIFNNQYGIGTTNCIRYYPFGCWITRDARAAR